MVEHWHPGNHFGEIRVTGEEAGVCHWYVRSMISVVCTRHEETLPRKKSVRNTMKWSPHREKPGVLLVDWKVNALNVVFVHRRQVT